MFCRRVASGVWEANVCFFVGGKEGSSMIREYNVFEDCLRSGNRICLVGRERLWSGK